MGVPESLVDYVMPKLKTSELAAKSAADAAREDGAEPGDKVLYVNLAGTLRQLVIASIQDAVVMADRYPENDFIAFLAMNEDFK